MLQPCWTIRSLGERLANELQVNDLACKQRIALIREISLRHTRNIEYPTAWWCLGAHRSFIRSNLILVSLFSSVAVSEEFSSLCCLCRRTVENNSFQVVEYSMSRNLSQNAVQLHFGAPTNVLPNVFVVELPDRQELCMMFATHIGVYRWILKHLIVAGVGQLVGRRFEAVSTRNLQSVFF
jgi:hypothetical protein